MIRLTDRIPPVGRTSAEWVKLCCTYECYPQDALFWEQDGGTLISLLDGSAVVCANGADYDELRAFLDMLNPCSVFSDLDSLRRLGRTPDEPSMVMARTAPAAGESPAGDELSSGELYRLLDVQGLSLPKYEAFAVDICRRLNHGLAHYFGLRGKCAAISLHTGNYAIMNGIASHKQGCGTLALNAILARNAGRVLLACCRPAVRGFYEKNGFELQYEAGYWVKNK